MSHNKIEALIFSTPTKFRNFNEVAVNSDYIELSVKLYYDYDKKDEKYSDEKKQ